MVWEYVSPWTLKGPVALLEDSHSFDDPTGLEDINIMSNFVHRAFRYGKDYPGLKGRDLSKAQVLFPKAPKWYELWDKASRQGGGQDSVPSPGVRLRLGRTKESSRSGPSPCSEESLARKAKNVRCSDVLTCNREEL